MHSLRQMSRIADDVLEPLNSFPFKGHLHYKQYIKGCAIHNSYQRAVTVHGTHEVRSRCTDVDVQICCKTFFERPLPQLLVFSAQAILDNNVASDVMAHTFFLEDGIETGNIFNGNLGFVTRASQVSVDGLKAGLRGADVLQV